RSGRPFHAPIARSATTCAGSAARRSSPAPSLMLEISPGCSTTLGLERTSLVGGSMGAQVALEVAVAQPERIDRLVLMDAGLPGHAWSDETRAGWAEEEAALERGDLDAAVEVNLRMWVDGPRRSAGAVAAGVRERVGEMQRR